MGLRDGLRRGASRLGAAGLSRLADSRLGQRVASMAEGETGAQAVSAAKFVASFVVDRVRDTSIGRTLFLPEAKARREEPWPEPSPRRTEPPRPPMDVAPFAPSPWTPPASSPSAQRTPDAAPPSRASREPIRTQTMARVLASQGQFGRARSIYRELLEKRPDDGTLRSELAAMEQSARDARMTDAPPSNDD